MASSAKMINNNNAINTTPADMLEKIDIDYQVAVSELHKKFDGLRNALRAAYGLNSSSVDTVTVKLPKRATGTRKAAKMPRVVENRSGTDTFSDNYLNASEIPVTTPAAKPSAFAVAIAAVPAEPTCSVPAGIISPYTGPSDAAGFDLNSGLESILKESPDGLGFSQLAASGLGDPKDVRKALAFLVSEGRVNVTGAKRGTKYHYVNTVSKPLDSSSDLDGEITSPEDVLGE